LYKSKISPQIRYFKENWWWRNLSQWWYKCLFYYITMSCLVSSQWHFNAWTLNKIGFISRLSLPITFISQKALILTLPTSCLSMGNYFDNACCFTKILICQYMYNNPMLFYDMSCVYNGSMLIIFYMNATILVSTLYVSVHSLQKNFNTDFKKLFGFFSPYNVELDVSNCSLCAKWNSYDEILMLFIWLVEWHGKILRTRPKLEFQEALNIDTYNIQQGY
jgi:hypothetical protein